MKAEKQADGFVPVVLTLQSQAEVDGLFAVLNHTGLTRVLERFGMPETAYECLLDVRSQDYEAIAHELKAIINDLGDL